MKGHFSSLCSGCRTLLTVDKAMSLVVCLSLSAWPVQAVESESSQADSQEAAAETEQPSLDERLDALLSEVHSRDEYGESKRCLHRSEYRSVDILNTEYLLFRRKDTYWLNKLRRPCGALRPRYVLTFRYSMSSICSGEPVYVSDRYDLDQGFDAMGRPNLTRATCTLGEFEAIAAEQAALLKGLK
jgi:hypothetical protein